MLLGTDWKKLLLAFAIMCSIWFVVESNARTYAAIDDYRIDYHADHAEIVSYRGTDTEIVIPETAGGLPVTAIRDDAFWGEGLTKVTLPASLETIGVRAFYENQLTEIEIPASVTSIGDFAFAYNQLTQVVLPENLHSIGDYAFLDNQLTQVVLPENLHSIGAGVFSGNVISEIEIPASVRFMEMNAFKGIGLTKLKLNEGLPEVGYAAFADNELTEVEVPASATSIIYAAFRNNKLNRVMLNEGLEEIWYSAFENNELTSVVIPSTVHTIYGASFLTNKLAYAVIPPSVNTIEHNSFGDNPADFTIIGSPGSPAHNFATTYNYTFMDAATIPMPDIQFTPSSQDWAQSAATTVTGATYNIYDLKYAWSNTESTPGPEVEWHLWGPGDVIEQTVDGEWYLHMQGSLLDRTEAWHSERFRVDRTPPTLDVKMTTGPSNDPYLNDTWSERPVTINATASDPYGDIRHIVVELDDGSTSSVAAYTGSSYSVTFAVYGTYELKITAIDQAGNASVTEQRIVKIVNSSPPSTSTPDEDPSDSRPDNAEPGDAELDDAEHTPAESACAMPSAFTDITGHWGESFIIEASCQAIVQGYPDGRFGPDRLVTRAEFTVMLTGLFPDERASIPLTFSDLAGTTHWAKQAIAQATASGIVFGYPDGSFRPEATITRAEMAVMITRALGLPTDVYLSTAFADDARIPAWAKNAVASIHQLGIVIGRGDNRFVPDGAATRAEAALMLLRTYQETQTNSH